MSENMEVRTLWAIRDARGLKAAEKALLFVIATRGEAYASAQTNADDMGASLSVFYDTRRALIEKGLILETLRTGSTTLYKVDVKAVKRFRILLEGSPGSTRGGLVESGEGSPESTRQREHLRKPLKETQKGTPKTPSVADAPEALLSDTHEPESHQSLEVDNSSEFEDSRVSILSGSGLGRTFGKTDKDAPLVESVDLSAKGQAEVFTKDTSVTEFVKGRDAAQGAEAPSTAPLEADLTNAESESAPESQEEMAEAQKPVKGRPRDASGLSGWDTEAVEPKPVFDLNAQWDEVEREQWEKSKRDDLETVPPSGTLDDRLAGW